MGIKELWTILGPFCERKPLYELQHKTVAIDLSCWVCESQNIAEYTVQPRMYLRNLYFRTCYLLLMDVNLVFVLEGKAPELKYKTIAARNAMQFKGQKPKTDKTKTGKDRSGFNHTLKLCEEMLKIMGLACVKGEGEAEALCAHLNQDDLVDGIISQDSDCFAYGAKIVYRNFSISQQGNHAAKGGSVDVYDISKAQTSLDFGRNKIIAMALLCGSDYSDGVFRIGKDSVLKLFAKISDEEILRRLRSWRQDSQFEKMEAKINDSNICTSCGHSGKIQSHTKKGCFECGTSQSCDSSKFKEERLEIKNELNMRSKALLDPEFPDENLIGEFLKQNQKTHKLNLKWSKPDLRKFVTFTVKYLTWEELYGFEKFFPILTRWQLLNPDEVRKTTIGIVAPKSIKKKRNPKGVPSYEIIWEDKFKQFENLVPEEQIKNSDEIKLWSTIEPQNLVENAYPELVTEFEGSKKKTKRKKTPTVDDINILLENVSITEPKPKKSRVKKVNTLDAFISKVSTPKKNFSFNLDQSNFGDENDLDVSDIIDDIVNRQNCSFFDRLSENDLFEKTFNTD